MGRNISEKLNKIIDEGDGAYRDIIVHLKTDDSFVPDAINAIATATRNRALVVDRSDIMPPPASKLEKPGSLSSRRYFKKQHQSMASQLAFAGLNLDEIPTSQRQNSAIAAIVGLINQEAVQIGIGQTKKRYKDKYNKHQPDFLWSSDSVRMTVPRDGMLDMFEDDTKILNVLPNKRLPAPRFSKYDAKAKSTAENQHNSVAWGIDAIGATKVWGLFNARGEETTVAVLDTGVDAKHPDLAGKIASWAEFDKNGRKVSGSTAHDSGSHGTHVCGTIVGGDKSGRYIGVAPEAKIAAGMVLDGDNGGTMTQVLAGMDWAIQEGVDVISMSLGGFNINPVIDTPYQRSILRALQSGIPVVAAIGNEGHQTFGAPGNDMFSYAIGAFDKNLRCAGFSGGRTQVIEKSELINPKFLPLIYSKPDVSAPGVDVYSSIPKNKWESFNGTSMATPHVAGAMALVLSATNIRANLSAHDKAAMLQDLLVATSKDMGESGQDHRFGFGGIDVFAAVDAAKSLGF